MTKPVVSVKWLHERLNHERIVLLDSSPVSNVSGKKSAYENQWIPGARAFDLKGRFSDAHAPYPNTLPKAEHFTEESRKLGINSDSVIVVYDNLGVYTSPRVWWMYKTMGHEKVYVLDGGLPAWIEAGYETTSTPLTTAVTGNFAASFLHENVRDFDDMVSNLSSRGELVLDARSKGRFDGTADEPRKGLPSGHIPHSVNIPFEEVLEHGKFKSEAKLKKVFEPFMEREKLVFSCGSGLTACIVLLASELVLSNPKSVYDGSWTEWAQLAKTENIAVS